MAKQSICGSLLWQHYGCKDWPPLKVLTDFPCNFDLSYISAWKYRTVFEDSRSGERQVSVWRRY